MEVRVLGALEVAHDGRPIEVRRPRERALLTLLACGGGQVVSSDRLIDGLWGESPPATAAKTLQTYIHHLRSLLPGGSILTEPSGYRLALPADAIDIFRFLAGLEEGRRLMADDRDAGAALLRTSLSLWRGLPAPGVEDANWIRPLVARLQEERVRAQTELIEAQIAAGSHEQVLAELHSLVDEHYLREDLWGLYMISLYRSGRQSEALRAYGEARRRLASELGIEPGPQLQRLEERILAQDPSLLAAGPDTAPPTEATVPEPENGTPLVREGMHSLVTLLGAQLAGIDDLGDELGHDRSLRIVAEADAMMESLVKRMGGTLVESADAGIVAMFGAPVAREDDTYRAVVAALRLTDRVADYGREIEKSWGVEGVMARSAVYTAPLLVPSVGSTEMDQAVSSLLRLAAATAPGSVLADNHTQLLMGDVFDWEDGPIDGGARQVRSVRRGTEKARMGRRLRAPLTGRDREMELATEAFTSLARGVGGILLVSGEAGVGKTRLVEELRAREGGGAGMWAVGHCVPYAGATPYWPFRDLLRSWLDVGAADTELQARMALRQRLDEALADIKDEVYPYLAGVAGITLEPDQATRLHLAPEALRHRTFEVVTSTLEGLAARAPVVAVIEDLHWADATSTRLLDHLLPLTDRAAVLIVLTTRNDPDHPSRALGATARQSYPHRTTEIALKSLSADAQRSMLESLVGVDAVPSRVADQILRLAEGNPFYLEELVGTLRDDARLSLPETVEKVVQARIDSLDRPEREMLTAASILGRSFGLPLLQGVVGEDGGGSIEVVQNLLRIGLLVEARRWPQAEYLFRHALIQEAAYRTLTPDRRVDLHRRAAGWLERHHSDNPDEVMGLLAGHWMAAGDEERAAAALIRAGDLARRDHALDEAVDHYRQLLPLLERRGDRHTTAQTLFKLALALHESLRFAEANVVYQQAFGAWDYEPSPEATATLRFRGPLFFDVPDPVRSYQLPDIQLQMALFDRLVERRRDDTLVPSLAERWEISDDGLRYVFTLREGLTWSDGAPLTAHDVEFAIKRNLDPDRPGVGVAMFYVIEGARDHVFRRRSDPTVIGVTALDDRTVEFRLNGPAPYLLGMLNRPDCGPQPRHAIEARGDEWGAVEDEVVSGAFRRAIHTDDLVVLERRADYGGSRQGNVRTVEWRFGTNADILGSFRREETDLAWIGSMWSGEGIEAGANDAVAFEPPAGLGFLVFNFRRPGIADLSLRLAMAQAIDRKSLAEILPDHAMLATGGVVPPPLAGHTPDIALPFDPDRSRRLLESVDVGGPISIVVPDIPGTYLAGAVRAVVEMWRHHLGLEFDVVDVDLAGYRAAHAGTMTVDILPSGWYPGYTDPEYFLRLLLHSEASANAGRFAYNPYDELVERACAARDEGTRLALLHQADRMAVAEQVAVIPLSYAGNVSLRRPGLTGWWEHGKSWASFADLQV